MIIKTEEKNGVKIYTVDKEYDDQKLEKKIGTFIKPGDIHKIINHNADVITADGQLLLRFRKNALDTRHVDVFYDNVVDLSFTISIPD